MARASKMAPSRCARNDSACSNVSSTLSTESQRTRQVGLQVFDNGVRGNGRHGPEARRVSEWKERIDFGGDNIGIDRWQRVLRPPALRREAPKP